MPRQKLQAGTAAALLTIFLHSLQNFLSPGASVFRQWGCDRLPGRLHVFLLVAAAEVRVPHLRMATLVLSTLALLGCVFLIYVLFHWLRDELNPDGLQDQKAAGFQHWSRGVPTSFAIRTAGISRTAEKAAGLRK